MKMRVTSLLEVDHYSVAHWFEQSSLALYITFVSNHKTLHMKITILNELSESNTLQIVNFKVL